jgi:gas vesicle protein
VDAGSLVIAFVVGVLVGGALGGLITYLYASAQTARLQAEKTADAEKLDWLARAQVDMQKLFGALALRSLKKSNEIFAGQIHQQLKHHADQIGQIRNSFESNLSFIDQRMRKNTDDAGNQMGQRLKAHSEQIGTLRSALQKELESLGGHVRQLEISREGAYKSLTTYLTSVVDPNSWTTGIVRFSGGWRA